MYRSDALLMDVWNIGTLSVMLQVCMLIYLGVVRDWLRFKILARLASSRLAFGIEVDSCGYAGNWVVV